MSDDWHTQSDNKWVERAKARCRAAYGQCLSTADRLAIARSWVRLSGGRLDFSQFDLPAPEGSDEELFRFDLARSGISIIRLIDTVDDSPTGIVEALRLDTRQRQVFTKAEPDGLLLRLTDHENYRSAAQKAAVRAMVTQPAGSGLMVSMPTGSGKSLLFQIAALQGRQAEAGACVIVITPTISLALDHARTLSGMRGLEGSRALTSDTTPAVSIEIIDAFRRGEVPVLFLSPEKAMAPELSAHLSEAASKQPAFHGLNARLTHIFVDEAHIIESWGRSFRPDFQRLPSLLSRLRNINPDLRAVLLSATLPVAARKVLRSAWTFDGAWLEIDAHTPRYEHDIVVAQFEDEVSRAPILDLVIDRAPRPLIIYTTEVEAAASLQTHLRVTRGYKRLELFTGDTSGPDRARIIQEWSANAIDIVVATSAFGMGIDNGDVRAVVHACLPESPARWYQEIGRASRDGGQGLAVCLFTPNDVKLAERLAGNGWLTRDIAIKRWRALAQHATNIRWEGAKRFLTLNLDAVRDENERRVTDYNRDWNRSLLTLMQRAGTLAVVSSPIIEDQPQAIWDIELLDPALLDPADTLVWDKIYYTRDAEVKEARDLLLPFVDLMSKPQRCLTQSTFQLIEPQADVPPCGRCPSCRSRGAEAPLHLTCYGLEKVWNQVTERTNQILGGVTLVAPDYPEFTEGLPKLINRLVAAGIEQFIVAEDLVDDVARTLSQGSATWGLVLSAEAWRDGAAMAPIATAILLPPEMDLAREVLKRIRSVSQMAHDRPFLVLSRPERLIDERRLDQSISRFAPLSEHQLDFFASTGNEPA